MKLFVAIASFLSAALASNPIFGAIADPACGPCIDRAVANGPGNTESKDFANYLCIGSGGTAVATCITLCGSSNPSLDPVAIAAVSAEIQIIMGSVFDYCIRYYPKETCAAFEGVFSRELLAKACSQTGGTVGGIAGPTPTANAPAAGSVTAAGSAGKTQIPKNSATEAHPISRWSMFLALVLVGIYI